MPVITRFRPIINRFLGRLLAPCLCPFIALAQEPVTNTEVTSVASEISSSSRSSDAPLYPSRDIRDKSLIASVKEDEAQWLETEYGNILALYRPTEAKTTQGVLILFHATETPQTWPPLLENLRAYLPRYGWETLAISLPQKSPATIPTRPSSSPASVSASSADIETAAESTETGTTGIAAAAASSSSSSSLSASPAVARDLLIQTYVDAAFRFLKEKGQLNRVILADNSSIHLVMQTLAPQIQANNRDATTIDGPLQALVIVNLQNQEPLDKGQLEEIFAAPQLPVLDIFFLPDKPEQIESRDLHRAVAMRKKVTIYQPLIMGTQPKSTEKDHQSYLVGRIRGFMQQQASGTEVKTTEDDTQNSQTQ